MDTNENQEFTLEEIMKEFGEGTAAETPELPEEDTLPSTDTIRMDPIEVPESKEDFSDTIRMDAITDDTIRMDAVADDTVRVPVSKFGHGQVRNAQPIEEEEEEQTEEVFSDQWEPEYEQPMGEYVPPQPIIFHPQSRLRELKRKLVAGPERRYYELSEQGLGKLQLAMAACLLVVLISGAVSVFYALGMIPAERTRLMVFGQLFLMLVAALPGSYQLIDGVTDLFKKRFSMNTMLVVTFLVCCVDAVFCLKLQRIPCCAAFSLQMFMSLWSAYHKRNTEMGMMDTMRKATKLDKLCAVEDYYQGRKGFVRDKAQVEDFMDNYRSPNGPEKVMDVYALVAMAVSLAIGVTAGVMHGLHTGVQVLSVSLLAAVPASAFVSQTRPMAVLERQLHKLGAVLCGWQGVKGLAGKGAFAVSHEDLFPVGSAKMNGVKFFGSREPDEIVAYCTALVVADGGGLSPLFAQVLESRNGRHYTVSKLTTYPGGIGGQVLGEQVLVGMLPFLRDMGVSMPEGIRVNQAVCVAIEGELCGLFAVTYEKNKAAVAAVGALCADRGIKTVLTNNDFMLTEGFLRSKFGIHPKRLEIPEYAVCSQLQQAKPVSDAPALVVSTQDGLAPYAYGAAGGRALRTASILGVIIHMTGGILGLLIMLALTVLCRTDLLTPMNLFLYHLVWLIPGLLITQWTKLI